MGRYLKEKAATFWGRRLSQRKEFAGNYVQSRSPALLLSSLPMAKLRTCSELCKYLGLKIAENQQFIKFLNKEKKEAATIGIAAPNAMK